MDCSDIRERSATDRRCWAAGDIAAGCGRARLGIARWRRTATGCCPWCWPRAAPGAGTSSRWWGCWTCWTPRRRTRTRARPTGRRWARARGLASTSTGTCSLLHTHRASSALCRPSAADSLNSRASYGHSMLRHLPSAWTAYAAAAASLPPTATHHVTGSSSA